MTHPARPVLATAPRPELAAVRPADTATDPQLFCTDCSTTFGASTSIDPSRCDPCATRYARALAHLPPLRPIDDVGPALARGHAQAYEPSPGRSLTDWFVIAILVMVGGAGACGLLSLVLPGWAGLALYSLAIAGPVYRHAVTVRADRHPGGGR